jgi:adenylate cyclase
MANMNDNKPSAEQMWHDWFMTNAFSAEKQYYKLFRRMFQALPHDPRCKFCHAPFHGIGGVVARTFFGKKPSSLNPRFCNVCEDYARQFPAGAEVEMSMLFADVRDSTALSEQMSPMAFSRLINRFYTQATKSIIEEDGLLEKLAGDAVAAFWGAGFAGTRYVERTLIAARNISKAMKQQGIPVGIGVHAGIAYFGAMGASDGLINISAIGDEVNLVARLASKAAAGEILVSEKALNEAGMDASGLETRSLELKGISKPVVVRVIHSL